jgi:hypothetical protein
MRWYGVDFLSATGTVLLSSVGAPGTTTTADRYARINGVTSTSASEAANFRHPTPVAMTLSNSQIYVTANTSANNTDIYLRKNASSTANKVTVTTATGPFSDTSNSVSFSAGDLANYFIDETGTSNFTISSCHIEAAGGSSVASFASYVGTSISAGTTSYAGPIGSISSTAVETDHQIVMRGSGTIRNFYSNILSYTASAGGSFVVRNNGADTAITNTFSATGDVNDLTNSFTYADGDKIGIKWVCNAGTGNFTPSWAVFEIVPDAETVTFPGSGGGAFFTYLFV